MVSCIVVLDFMLTSDAIKPFLPFAGKEANRDLCVCDVNHSEHQRKSEKQPIGGKMKGRFIVHFHLTVNRILKKFWRGGGEDLVRD